MKEIWKNINGFIGKYQISNTGKVKSIDRIDANGRFRNGIELKQLIESQGYYRVTLWHNRYEKEDIRVHYLVAKHFIPNSENKPTVNHKDGNKLNNNVSNLEWNTYSENNLHAYKIRLKKPAMTGKFNELHHNSKPIEQLDSNLKLVKKYPSLMEAYRKTGINYKNISRAALNGKTSGGYFWKYTK